MWRLLPLNAQTGVLKAHSLPTLWSLRTFLRDYTISEREKPRDLRIDWCLRAGKEKDAEFLWKIGGLAVSHALVHPHSTLSSSTPLATNNETRS